MDNPNRWHDWYDVLLVSPSASQEEIQQSYNTLIFAVHPDKNKTPQAHEMAKLVNAAKEALLDKDERARFDRQRAERAQSEVDIESHPIYRLKKLWYESKLEEERNRRKQAEHRARVAERRSPSTSRKEVLLTIELTQLKHELQAERNHRIEAEAQSENLMSILERAVKRAERAEAAASANACNRSYLHCDVCPKSYSHGYPSLPYVCYNLQHCRACFELQKESLEFLFPG